MFTNFSDNAVKDIYEGVYGSTWEQDWLDGIYKPLDTDKTKTPHTHTLGIANKTNMVEDINISRTKDDKLHFIEATLPGFSEDEVEVVLNDDGDIVITAEKESTVTDDTEQDDVVYTYRGFSKKNVNRVIKLSPELKDADINVTLEYGVLTIVLKPKEKLKVQTKLF